ncbi:MAG: hypothetical protein EOM05_12770, partial [Clostridia bacterium]|nr:hypothetical protein [Clostridia bacterium]
GWHIPTQDDWETFENFLADYGYNYDGSTGGEHLKIAKAMATPYGWSSSSLEGTVGNNDYPDYQNSSGFSALPGGYRDKTGRMYISNLHGYWWINKENGDYRAYYFSISYCYSHVANTCVNKKAGLNVRCLKD